MGDLISRSALINTIVNSPTDMSGYNPVYCDGTVTRQNEIIDIINAIPCAYNVEKVVEQIDGMYGVDPMYYGKEVKWCVDKAIDIVRNGGKE